MKLHNLNFLINIQKQSLYPLFNTLEFWKVVNFVISEFSDDEVAKPEFSDDEVAVFEFSGDEVAKLEFSDKYSKTKLVPTVQYTWILKVVNFVKQEFSDDEVAKPEFSDKYLKAKLLPLAL